MRLQKSFLLTHKDTYQDTCLSSLFLINTDDHFHKVLTQNR